MEPRTISLIRYGVLATVFLFSLITLGLAGHLLSLLTGGVFVPDFLGLNVAIPVITMVVLAVSIGIDFFRKGAFTSLVVTELAWTFLLTILWIATAGDTTSLRAGVSCNAVFPVFDSSGFIVGTTTGDQTFCHESQALIAFSWLTFLLMLGWFVTLVTLTVTAHMRGQTNIWLSPVNGTDFLAQRPMGDKTEYGSAPQQQQQYTGGTTQQSYPPSGYATSPAPGVMQV